MANKNIKVGILVGILVIPIFFIMFLYLFGKNHYELPVFYPNGIYGDTPGEVHTIPDFNLTTEEGKPFTRKDMEGKIAIVDFVFTRCGSICPIMTNQFTRVQQEFKDNDDVILLSHTVDPDFDTPEVLKEYGEANRYIPGKWQFLTGTEREIYDLASKGYMITALPGDSTDEDLFVHSEKVILVDKQGRIRGYYNGVDPTMIDTLVIETRILLQE